MDTRKTAKTQLKRRTAVSPQTTRTQPAQQRPTLLGRYRQLEVRATGGFGSVLVCWDTRLQRRVAVKQIPLGDAMASQTLSSTLDEALAEARTSSMLSHPNIVTMYDFESDGAFAYLVMEYVDGINLAELLARVEGGTLTYDECAHVLGSVGEALAFAHENGVLHLDIKPANILIDRQGTVKLSDFGMATLASAAGYGDARGGTVGYMPPEQIEGGLLDERSDLFSLAVVCIQSLTGSNPFAAPTADKSLALIRRGPKQLARDLADIPSARSALECAVEADPVCRMASVPDLVDAVVAPMGDAREGRASLCDLLEQLSDDSGAAPARAAAPPLSDRIPQLPGILVRAASCACCAAIVWRAAPLMGVLDPATAADGNVAVGMAAVAGAISALFPSLGCGAALVAMALALGADAGRLCTATPHVAVGAAVIFGVIVGLWWVRCTPESHLAGPALLAPIALLAPGAGAGMAGFALGPLGATATGVIGSTIALLAATPSGAAADAGGTLGALSTLVQTPTQLVTIAGCGLAACLCSIVTRRNARVAAMVGQLACAAVLVASAILAHLENGGLWEPEEASRLAIAVILSLIVGVVAQVFDCAPQVLEVE